MKEPAERVSAQVSVLLYDRNLISDPEVRARMGEYVLSASRDGVPVDTVMLDFASWLEEWVHAHPDRVEAARLASRPYRPGQ